MAWFKGGKLGGEYRPSTSGERAECWWKNDEECGRKVGLVVRGEFGLGRVLGKVSYRFLEGICAVE